MRLHDVEELDEHGGHVTAGHGRGVADLLCELAGRDGTHADGSAVPLAEGLAACDLVLINVESDCHSCLDFKC